MEQIRTVVMGYGEMGRKYARILGESQVEGMCLAGVCCRGEAARNQAGAQYPGIALYSAVEEAFAHEKEFDAVVIATPHTAHVEIGMQAFARGKHVMCEKPLGTSAAEVRKLLEARKEGVGFAVMFNNRALPAFEKARALLQEGKLGAVTRAVWVCNKWFRSPAYHKSAPWRSSWQGEHGGLLMNQCQHNLDLWQWLLGMPDVVDADLDFGKYNDFQVDDGADLRLIRHGRGERPDLRGSFISSSGEHPGVDRLEIWGERGRMTVEGGKTLTIDWNLVDISRFNRENQEPFAQPEHKLETVSLEQTPPVYRKMLQNFSDHLRFGTPLIAPGQEGLFGVQLTNAAYLSAWTGQRVRIPFDELRYEALLREREERERNLLP